MEKIIKKIEVKLTKVRKLLSKEKLALILLSIFTICFAYAMEVTKLFQINKNMDNDKINRATYDAAEYIKNVETLLIKAQITSTPEQSAKILAEIWKQSSLASSNMVELPSNQETVENSSNFLSQLSDYSFLLMKKSIEGVNITEKEYQTLENMHEYAKNINKEFSNLVADLNSGKIKWDEVEKNLKDKKENKEMQALGTTNLGKTMQDYQGLIYDGAFSNHILNIVPTMFKNKNININDGKNIIKKLYGEKNIESIKYIDTTNGNIETYGYSVKLTEIKESIDIQITKDTGYIIWILSDKNVVERNLSIEESKKAGKEFLEKLGYKNMKDTYYSIYENMITINYAYEQDGCIMYTDLIKVKVALDNGMVCSLESNGYIYNHKENRNLNTKITLNQARNKINKKLEITASNLAYIPTDSLNEILVYEFKGKIEDKYFLVYINALTGVEEKILVVIDSEKGILTM